MTKVSGLVQGFRVDRFLMVQAGLCCFHWLGFKAYAGFWLFSVFRFVGFDLTDGYLFGLLIHRFWHMQVFVSGGF